MSDVVKPDTSEAAVERDAATVEHFARVWPEDAEESVRDAMRNSLVHIAALLRALLAERDAAAIARDDAIRRMADASRDAGRWRGISEGNDVVIKHLRAERDALRAQLTEAKEALQPFAFLARVNARLNLDPELPLKDFVPGVWPKWKDVQRALAALREAGQTFGREAQIADDGSDMREVLVAKVPDLVAALRAQRDSLRDALEKALEWIEGWDPGFTMEPDWPADHAAMRGVLATLREAGHE